ncbi:b18a01b6-d481-416a-8678-63976d69315e [Thermothielavioides terrestris]|uniref:Uncharacterized protein n=2 Tax=Thermothielavioides terrestris TaxID=2587410 RepID=G2QRT0_THETT|nr:uncharacterized protein THITE_62838 [Thermothielavioides terrestris NRRL 8126]AEO64224.1 hypothetical protein THITE_62838 [Thermothielavioides terrestris NRRL 8126]SPQ26925.1 b18a01b6-d481-416a-8678-63976d69315e [Thermothielavioides terrestris]
MLPGVSAYNSALVLLLAAPSWTLLCAAAPWTGLLSRRQLIFDYSPAPPPDQGPPLSAGALRDPAFLPAQIGGIVGAYAFSLVLVALLLLGLSKRRREHLRNRDFAHNTDAFFDFNPFPEPFLLQSEEEYQRRLEAFQNEQLQNEQFQHEQFRKLSLQTDFPRSPVRNFSLPASASPLSPTKSGPLSPTKSQRSAFTSSPTSTVLAPGIDLSVDQSIVNRDRAMAQQQLEEMYKYVMEHEQAKAEGREYQGPPLPVPPSNSAGASPAKAGSGKKEKNKPSNLNLARDEKNQSRGSSIFSFLKSPRKNKTQAAGMNISSPIMTPMSGTFPRHRDDQEMNPMSPRQYAPPAPPPGPSDLPFRRATAVSAAGSNQLPTPDISPVSTQSIDSRIDAAIGQVPARTTAAPREQRDRETRSDSRLPSHSRDVSTATSTSGDHHEPVSASSEKSTSNLVGLPTSPRPGVNRFPSLDSLPASPRPGQQSFLQHSNSSTSSGPKPASAVREGGTLPLRAYEPSSLSSPTAASFATKQTVFTRADPGPLSPGAGGLHTGGLRSPWTGAPVPYSPYQPFSPVIPITPTVVTRADRKRMKKLEPRTPTVEMVKDTDEIW